MASPTFTPLPTPPNRETSPETFSSDADSFLGALPQFQTDGNTIAAFCETEATTAETSASTAEAARDAAITARNAAQTAESNASTSASNAATSASSAAASAAAAAASASSVEIEEGVWVPTLTSGASSISGYSNAGYIKVGNLVTAWVKMDVVGISSSTILFSGLPYFSKNFGSAIVHYYGIITQSTDFVKMGYSSSTQFVLVSRPNYTDDQYWVQLSYLTY